MPRVLAVMAITMLFACRPAETGGLDRSTFIDVMVQLRQASREFPDSNAFDAKRREILVQAEVTDSALTAFVERHGTDATYMAEVWDSIDRRVNPPDTATADTVHEP